MDITRDVSVLVATKPHLLARLREVERVIGRAVVFDRNDALPADSGGKATPDGTVTLARDSAVNLSVIGEEIMHLDRWTSGYPVIQPAPIGGLSAPTLSWVLAIAAPNKVAGFAVVKVLNLINLLPLVAYFVPMPAQFLAGILPAFWPMRAFWAAAEQKPIWPFLIAGMFSGLLALLLTVRRFAKRVGTQA